MIFCYTEDSNAIKIKVIKATGKMGLSIIIGDKFNIEFYTMPVIIFPGYIFFYYILNDNREEKKAIRFYFLQTSRLPGKNYCYYYFLVFKILSFPEPFASGLHLVLEAHFVFV